MSEEKLKDQKEGTESIQKIPFWEWIIALIGFICVATAIGTALNRAINENSKPPDFEVSVKTVTPINKGFLVIFEVKNAGNQTAAALNIEGELKKGEESIEKSTASMSYAPANSTREGGLIFTRNPAEFEIEIRAVGYEKP